jgi:hypothetical protein
MRMAKVATVVALGIALAGCGHGESVELDRRVALVPPDLRPQVTAAQRRATRAEGEVELANRAVAKARGAQVLAAGELQAAEHSLEDADRAMAIAMAHHNPVALGRARQAQGDGRDQVLAAQARLTWANRLADLRRAERDVRQQELLLAQSQVRLAEERLLAQQHLAAGMDRSVYLRQQEDAQVGLANARHLVAQLTGEVAALGEEYQQKRARAAGAAGAPLPSPPPPFTPPTP